MTDQSTIFSNTLDNDLSNVEVTTELMARFFRTLGEVTRLNIVMLLLEEDELFQMEIVRRLGLSQGRVSEHLNCLVWCGLVQSRTQGRRVMYSVANDEVKALLGLALQRLKANESEIATCSRLDSN